MNKALIHLITLINSVCVLRIVLPAGLWGCSESSCVFVCSPETQAEPSLQATQMKLKRARLAHNLNEKIAQRPGPLVLVEKNILPVDSAAEEGPDGRTSESQQPWTDANLSSH